MTKQNRILLGYTGLWPRELIEEDELLAEIKGKLNRPGLYVLYRDDKPFYIGQAAGWLWNRLRQHARESYDKQYYFWNFFSAFVVPSKHIDEAEAMLIAAMPTTNSAKPRIPPIRLSLHARRKLKEVRFRRLGLEPRTRA